VTDLIPLHLLSAGQTGQIGQLMGRPEQVQRLEELGLRDGVEIEMVCGGTPCIVRLNGQRVCFRGGEALNVLVQPGTAN
jgi:Fe2+ transport system protein FeoA